MAKLEDIRIELLRAIEQVREELRAELLRQVEKAQDENRTSIRYALEEISQNLKGLREEFNQQENGLYSLGYKMARIDQQLSDWELDDLEERVTTKLNSRIDSIQKEKKDLAVARLNFWQVIIVAMITGGGLGLFISIAKAVLHLP